jgi:hypothetical protein
VLAFGSLLFAGCGGPPAGGDPGGKRLHELGADRVFAALPDGATHVSETHTRASYRKPSFGGGGWLGPSVVVVFTSASPPPEVFDFYARRARDAGWKPTAAGALGLTDRWAKTYPDGAAATLVLSLLPDRRTYRLSGAVAPVPR